MTESCGIENEYRKLTTNMNVPLVNENLHVMSLGNRDIPYDTRLSTFANQNKNTKKPDILLDVAVKQQIVNWLLLTYQHNHQIKETYFWLQTKNLDQGLPNTPVRTRTN